MKIDVKRPCGNCPFLRVGAIDLHPGRLRQIVDDLLRDDRESFVCHKTISGNRADEACDASPADEWDDAEEGRRYRPGSKDRICAGLIALFLKLGAPSVAMRMASAVNSPATKRLKAL